MALCGHDVIEPHDARLQTSHRGGQRHLFRVLCIRFCDRCSETGMIPRCRRSVVALLGEVEDPV
jgi:hypothetical protein